MNPVVSNLTEENNYLKFRLSGVNVSLANGLRRIVLSEVPTVVFRTTPHDKNKANITINTTRMNNELITNTLLRPPVDEHISIQRLYDTNLTVKNSNIALRSTRQLRVVGNHDDGRSVVVYFV